MNIGNAHWTNNTTTLDVPAIHVADRQDRDAAELDAFFADIVFMNGGVQRPLHQPGRLRQQGQRRASTA